MSRLSYDYVKYRADLGDKLGNLKAANKLRISPETIYRARKLVSQIEASRRLPTLEEWRDLLLLKQTSELQSIRAEVKALKAYYLYKLFLNSRNE